jgi:hypothetical protein
MPLRGFIAAFVLGVLATQADAADPIGYAEAFDTLYSVDLVTHQATEIGRATPPESNTRFANISGLTFNPGGALYAVSDAGATKTLLTIDPNTGLATVVGALDLGSTDQLDLGLAFTCDGALWMSAHTGDFWRVNPQTGSVGHVGNLGVTVTGLAASRGKLYAAGGQGNNNLYIVDPNNATATPVGSFDSTKYITTTSFGFDGSGQIWSVLDYVPPQTDTTPVQPWSDLGQISPEGALDILAPITPAQSQSSADLEYIGLKGLAIPSGICAAAVSLTSAPTLSWYGLAILLALLALVGGTRARRRHPIS